MAMPKAAGYEAWRIIQYEDDVSVWMRGNSFANPPLYQHTLDLPPHPVTVTFQDHYTFIWESLKSLHLWLASWVGGIDLKHTKGPWESW